MSAIRRAYLEGKLLGPKEYMRAASLVEGRERFKILSDGWRKRRQHALDTEMARWLMKTQVGLLKEELAVAIGGLNE